VRRVDTATRSFEITISQDATGSTHGALAIRTATGDTVRAVDGASCDETIAALVVVAALAVTRSARSRRAGAAAATPGAVTTGGTLARDRQWPRTASRRRAGGCVRRARVRRDRARARAPTATGVRTHAQQAAMVSAGASEFRWTVGRLDLRPIAFARGPLELAPSIGIEAGALTARGTQVGSPAGDHARGSPQRRRRIGLHVTASRSSSKGSSRAAGPRPVLHRARDHGPPGTVITWASASR